MTLSDAEMLVRRLVLLQLTDDLQSVTREQLADAVDMMIAIQPDDRKPTIDRERVLRDVEAACNVWVDAPLAIEGHDDHLEWLHDKMATIDWRFWNRYRRWLEEEQDFPPAVVRRLNGSTNEILKRLEDPSRTGRWDRRGMVVGHVQSGKTANYTGLICKAADAGYKLIVVLAGIHNSLRSQTQLRLDEGFIGFDTQRRIAFNRDNTRIGAGAMVGADFPVVHPLTTSSEGGDFNSAVAQSVGVTVGGSDPVILVVKKHRRILENLTKWATANQAVLGQGETTRRVPKVPILVIDDECDHASVNTKDSFDSFGDFDADLEPSAINGAIRTLLNSFEQSAYVGYTATPFANIFIYKDAKTDRFGEDIFPRSFIIGLKKSSQYVGPDRVFGLLEDPSRGIAETKPLPIVVDVTDHEDWVPSGHKKHLQVSPELPSSLRRAMLGFVLACAARRARGQVNKHNSMLVHVTRFKDVQAQVRDAVDEELQYIKDQIEFADGGSLPPLISELETLWNSDFVPTTAAFGDESLTPIAWENLRDHLHAAASKIQVKVINGDSSDALDYYDRRSMGMSVIAIGGDKLSRGLTLEGLSVSYYLRASKMYDTLLQMGRWFGFRPGYGDLCRLYTTPELQGWYERITAANEELFQQFEEMAILGGTPNDFGLRVANSPDGLLITARTKLRTGTKLRLSFAGNISETIMFPKDGTNAANYTVSERFVSRIKPHLASESVNGNYLFLGVPAEEILTFLRSFRTHPGATKAQSKMLVSYIEGRVRANPAELTEWTVALISNDKQRNRWRFADLDVGLTERSPHKGDERTYAIRRLISPPDEWLDLTPEQYQTALDSTRSHMRMNESPDEPSAPSGPWVRVARPKTRGLLLMYLLDPVKAEMPFDETATPVVGIGLSFPGSDHTAAITYTVNNTYWDELLEL